MIFKKGNQLFFLVIFFLQFALTGCMKDDQWVKDHLKQTTIQLGEGGLFVVNEGNFMYGNATLSFYDTLKREIQNDLFYRANGLPLGDVAESMSIRNSTGYIVINNSGKIYILDTNSGKYLGKITGLTSPRFLHFVNSEKAYVTDLYAQRITIVNPTNYQVTGVIQTPSHPSTEEMVQVGNLLFVTCWSGDKTVLVIDISKDQIIAEIATGIQPCGIVADHFGKIWVLCQSLPGNNSKSNAQLQRIDPVSLSIDKSFTFNATEKPVKLTIDGKGENLFYILGNAVMKMAVSDEQLPDKYFISINSKILYSLGIDPANGNIYVGDALDYQQSGLIFRYSEAGKLLDTFKAGIIPGRFCFK